MTKFPIKTVAACAVVALGIGATSATAGSLITSHQIKDGAVHMRDLSPGVKAKLAAATATKAAQNGKDGAAGTNGANGSNGADGATGANGSDGQNGIDGRNGVDGQQGIPGLPGLPGAPGLDGAPGEDGQPGKPGKDGVRYDRIVGSCDDGSEGEVTVYGGEAHLNVPTQMSWAQIRSYPESVQMYDVDELSFKANASDEGQTYMKIRTTGHNTITFSPNTQPDGETLHEMVTYDVLEGTARWNDAKGNEADFSWEQILEKSGNERIKSISVIAGCAQGDGGETIVDDITVNHEVLGFS